MLQKDLYHGLHLQEGEKNQGERAMYYVENNHPAIISREVFDQVRNEMTRRSSKAQGAAKRVAKQNWGNTPANMP